MKNRIIMFVIVILTSFFTLRGVITSFGQNSYSSKVIRAEILLPKDTFTLGEILPLRVLFTNEGEYPISIENYLDAKDGNINILVSQDGKTYKSYSNSYWGTSDIKHQKLLLKPSQQNNTFVNILWNYVPSVSNVSKLSSKQILTNYVFEGKGNYFVKVSFTVSLENKVVEIESEPIKITIEEPKGEDLEVWNKIKDNGSFAYFIQEGDMLIPSYKAEERAKFQAEIEDILNKYPNSFYAEPLRQSLDKFKISEAKRLAFEEKLKANAKPQ
jgi:hypothetical protein